MSDDLVKQLREHITDDRGYVFENELLSDVVFQAADRIEELEDKLDWVIVERDETFALMLDRAQTAEAKLAKAVEALEKLDVGEGWAAQVARTAIAELKGGKDYDL